MCTGKFGLLPVVMRGENCRQYNAMFLDSFHDLLTGNHHHIIKNNNINADEKLNKISMISDQYLNVYYLHLI